MVHTISEYESSVPSRHYELAMIGGDGIGPEVLGEARRCLEALAPIFDFEVSFREFDLGADRYLRTGELITDQTLASLSQHDAILIGAVGDPRVEPGVLERGLILRIRTEFELSVNVRPAQLFPGVPSLIRGLTPDRCDLVIVRENTEGLYSGSGFTSHAKSDWETAVQLSLNTRHAISASVDFAFRLAQRRRRKLTLCHKTNILLEAGRLWWAIVQEFAERYPDVTVDYVHADACSAYLVEEPERFDVIVTDNLFGDILSDLAAVVQGGLGLAPSANLNLTGTAPSMFEPVHGSAPDIVGTGGANPAGAIFAAAMCLSHLGEKDAARALERATIAVLGTLGAMRGPEMGATTAEIGEKILMELSQSTVSTGVASGASSPNGTFRSCTDLTLDKE
jgi:3-isopropylmalate dehydrogenase